MFDTDTNMPVAGLGILMNVPVDVKLRTTHLIFAQGDVSSYKAMLTEDAQKGILLEKPTTY